VKKRKGRPSSHIDKLSLRSLKLLTPPVAGDLVRSFSTLGSAQFAPPRFAMGGVFSIALLTGIIF